MEAIKKGQIVVMTSGSYSDYSLNGVFVALQEISKEECETVVSRLTSHQFLYEELVKEGKLKRIDAAELCLDLNNVFSLRDISD